ncbi:sugar transferase [Scytonema sp. UIC 10036]|uniref:heterocyst development glycosyltransferase HepC n=1 Tax=Scytonema sp. UIC 10036 TaxID=2304196 RepID=UPI0012DA623E|nr:heterocyst development glycosyltransferase HepC [Scytonema sp. UIC 10036]MUH00042.1 sugar transferase [Scytonema sp. UIC 10036]
MTTSIIPTIQSYYTVKQQPQDNPPQYCTIQWRRNQLLVMPPGQVKQPYMPSLHQKHLLVECLKATPATLVRIDPKLGEARLQFWADACQAADLPIFLRIPSTDSQPKISSSLQGALKRLSNWLVALIFLIAFAPLILGLVSLMYLHSKGPIFSCQWHIGERGRLFKVIKFRTTVTSQKAFEEDAVYQNSLGDRKDKEELTVLGRWMRKYGLDNLPQLLNVLRGEMSLTGPRCWSLKDAVRLNFEAQRHLNRLPGIMGLWEVEAESDLLHLDSQIS